MAALSTAQKLLDAARARGGSPEAEAAGEREGRGGERGKERKKGMFYVCIDIHMYNIRSSDAVLWRRQGERERRQGERERGVPERKKGMYLYIYMDVI